MKTGKTLTELAQELERQKDVKKDYLADTRNMRIVEDSGKVRITVGDDLSFPIKPIAHRQIGEHTKIPAPYYDRMMNEAPDLLATNINTWFDKHPAVRMGRTLDDHMRAFLSNSFRPLDNFDLAEAVLPPLNKLGVQIMSCDITETKFYLKVIDERVKRDLKPGQEMGKGHDRIDVVSPAMIVSNSEVGMGRMAVETGVYTWRCTNMAVFSSHSKRKAHLGARLELGDDVYAMLSDSTRRLTDAALWAQISDFVAAAFERARFDSLCQQIEGTANNQITGDPIKTVELVTKELGFNETEKSSVLQHLIRGGDLSQYGLHAAITRAAEDVADYDRASEFEKFGGKIIELPTNDWKRFAEAA